MVLYLVLPRERDDTAGTQRGEASGPMSTHAERIENSLRAAFPDNCVALQFSHRGAAAVTLSARISSQSVSEVASGSVVTEQRVVVLRVIAGQTGFAVATGEAEPVTPGDIVTFLSREYEVLAPIGKSSCGVVYDLNCTEFKRLAQGVGR
jgi:hypothetical protein